MFQGGSLLGRPPHGAGAASGRMPDDSDRVVVSGDSDMVVVAPADTEGHFLTLQEGSLKLADLTLQLGGQRVGVMLQGGSLQVHVITVLSRALHLMT